MGNGAGTPAPPEPATTFNQAVHQGYAKGMAAGMKEGIAKGTTLGFQQGLVHGTQTKVASAACFAFLSGSLATLGAIFAAGYLGKRGYEKAQAAEERERLSHFRDAHDVGRVESVILDPDRTQTCQLENLLRAVEDLNEPTLDQLQEDLHHLLVMFPENLRRWRVFQANTRRLMEEPNNSPICGASQKVATSGTDHEGGAVRSASLIPLVLRNAELDSMVELQDNAIAQYKEKQKRLKAYAKDIDDRLRKADDVREVYKKLASDIWFIELAEKALGDELAVAVSVREDLERLQRLHDQFINWILEYRAWKSCHDSGRDRPYRSSFPSQKGNLRLETNVETRRSSTIEINITEPVGLMYDEPPPGYDTKLLLNTCDGSDFSDTSDETPSTAENDSMEDVAVVE